jgi:hypothetical protein
LAEAAIDRHGSDSSGRGTEAPLDILKNRCARAEIKKEEFDRMKKDLSRPKSRQGPGKEFMGMLRPFIEALFQD